MRVVWAAIATLTFLVASAEADDFRRADWVADFEQLKAAITRNSPNLDWALSRGLDLPELERSTRERLEREDDAEGAQRTLMRFVEAFGDGHMELQWPRASRSSDKAAPPSACAALGYWSAPDTSAIATLLPGYQSLAPAGANIEAGLARVGDIRLGVLRLSLFAPNEELCERALAELALAPRTPCDEACAGHVARRADDFFLSEIAERIRALASSRPGAILVDVAGNGGGNDTSIAIARMFANSELPSPPMAMARGEERAQRLSALADELAAPEGDPAARTFLAPLVANLRDAARDAGQPCDMLPMWSGVRPSCSNLIRGEFFAGGLIATELPARFRGMDWAESVSATARFRYPVGVWQGPLIVLVDENSASSTELFAAMLQDSGHAHVIGAPTYGAGCGWNMPRQDVVLKHSGGRVSIPNCARFRRDGRNEIDGLEPNLLIGFRPHDTPRQRVERLLARLPTALQAVEQRRGRRDR